jgi:hypothetical protein
MQQELFELTARASSRLHGMTLKLEGGARTCCSDIAVIHPGKGPHAGELRCVGCGKHAGWLSKEAATWLSSLLDHFPQARFDAPTLRIS